MKKNKWFSILMEVFVAFSFIFCVAVDIVFWGSSYYISIVAMVVASLIALVILYDFLDDIQKFLKERRRKNA